MDLRQYYKENKDEINSSIMEIASDLAVARLVEKHQMPFDSFVEPEDPDDPDSGTCYKEEYQDEYKSVLRRGIQPPCPTDEIRHYVSRWHCRERQRFSGNRSQDGLRHGSLRHREPKRWRGVRGGYRRHPRPVPPRHENRGRHHCEHRNLRPQ